VPNNVRPDLKTHLFTFIVIATNVLGNFALSWGLRHGSVFSPYALLGVSLLIVWFLSRMTLLSWADLSYVLPVTSIGYVLTAFIGKYFLGEQINVGRWLGTFLIACGTVLVGSTAARTARS
jgi:uncharacterized membrane protein